ncbi:MATE family efflux transporter [Pseudorhodobacter aquimaris]|uniref:MATE family efflux transporter n=1 Tax=Pseudorhodobacter aquimaris TaxID=687412 RepID=UPI00067A80A7|nr:MATE family efflux transporter [Pseudorhodobacter aquimaris]
MARGRSDRDLTRGAISGHFRALALPAAVGMLFSTLYNVVDVYFAGQISTEAQAGLAIGFQAFFINMAVGFGLGGAMGALVGKAKGGRDEAQARRLAVQGISLGVLLTLGLMLIAVWLGPAMIALVSEAGEYRDAGTNYFRWLIFALPGFLLAYGGNGVLQARGDTKSLQRALMVAFFANIGLNPLFIYGVPGVVPGIGFNGIALSTLCSQTGVMLYIMYQVFGRKIMQGLTWAEFRPDPAVYGVILRQMLPTSLSIAVMFTTGFVIQYYLKAFGGSAVAAYGIALRVEQIMLLPVLGMTGALLPIAAQNFGAEDPARVRQAVFFCWKLGFAMMAVACPVLWFGGEWAMGLFTDDAEVIRVGVSYLHVDGFLLPFYMMLFSINSFLQAMQRPIWSLWISVYRQGIAVALFVWVMVRVFDLGIWGVWFGVAIAVTSGWGLAMTVATRVARQVIGGLWVRP